MEQNEELREKNEELRAKAKVQERRRVRAPNVVTKEVIKEVEVPDPERMEVTKRKSSRRFPLRAPSASSPRRYRRSSNADGDAARVPDAQDLRPPALVKQIGAGVKIGRLEAELAAVEEAKRATEEEGPGLSRTPS